MQNSSIQWTDHTFNPWIGCTKISPGCKNCYAEFATPTRTARAQGRELWGKGKARSRTSEAYWKQPVKWHRMAHLMIECATCSHRHILPEGLEESFCPACGGPEGNTVRPRVFCASLADWLDDEVPIPWLADLLKLIHATPNLDWLLLTKRPENFEDRILDARNRFCGAGDEPNTNLCAWLDGWRHFSAPPHNIWIGATIEDQPRADQRTPALLKIPAAIRFLSVEPMLEPIDFPTAAPCGYYCDDEPTGEHLHRPGHGLSGIHWAIFGGESGPNARPCHLEWIRDGLRQCRAADVAPFVKQLGAHVAHLTPPERALVRDKKGADMSEWPPDLRIRQFPPCNHLTHLTHLTM